MAFVAKRTRAFQLRLNKGRFCRSMAQDVVSRTDYTETDATIGYH